MNIKRELVLILDDYHLIQSTEVHGILEYLLEHAPLRLHLVLLTRSDPPFKLARLRVTGQLTEIRMQHLRFTAEEAAEFLKKAAGVQLTEDDAAALIERTEGWVAGLQMAAISLRGREDAAGFIAAFAGSHRFVFDYLLEQVLNRQPQDLREFLLQTSVLERMSAHLCDAVAPTGRPARILLDSIERANLFLVPLDDERTWYRYHHLFADLLRLMLEQTHPGLTDELHRRACNWYESQEMLPEALHHALAAKDMMLAARLVSANVLALVEHAELVPILLRMDAAPYEQRASLPWLEVAHAWSLAYTGQMARAEEALSLSEKHRDELPENEQTRMAGHTNAVRAYMAWALGKQQEAVEYAMEAALFLPAEEHAVRALNMTTLGNALVQYEADPRAMDLLEQAVVLARQARQSHVFMPAATALAFAYLMLGLFRKAHAVCLEAIEVADMYQRRTGQALPAAASAYAELAVILGEWGEIEKSIQVARKGLTLSELWGQTDTTMLCLLALAEGMSLAHDTESSLAVLQRARKIAKNVSPWFVFEVDKLEMRTLLDAGEVARAARLAPDMGARLPAALEARLLIKEIRFDEALALVQRSLPEAMNSPSLEAVRLSVIQALAYYLKNEDAQALSAIKRTLELAEPENQIMTFVRQGPVMEKLLRLALSKSICPAFVRRLLGAFDAQRKPISIPTVESLVEPLSERELEVLQHLNGPLSTPEIAEQLVVSANTVRTHIKSIYGKLGVHGRSAAVWRARELGLLG
ncbi:MAG: hypothetical protein EHM41_16625 [Chloroflexi bacterium]|nr:MAG: hypothetical protein EHM41_16625 [Chloroflexota bacterium]